MEMDVLNAVAGGQDDHSSLRYRFGFVDITRTMTPMVGLPVIDSNRSFSLSSTESFFGEHRSPNGWQNCTGFQFLCSKLIEHFRVGDGIASITWQRCTQSMITHRHC